MGLFERFTNPVWHRVSTLDSEHQSFMAFVIIGYDFLREALKDSLLEPLWKSGMVSQGSVNSDIPESLIDEAAIGLMKSLDIPESDPNGKISYHTLSFLPQIWGCFALADKNHRLKCSGPESLEGTPYSKDTDEARTQVLVEWSKILHPKQPNFVLEANQQWFHHAWASLSAAYLNGTLRGFGRIPDVLKRARSVSQQIPSHRIQTTLFFIEKMGKVPLAQEPPRTVFPGHKISSADTGVAQGDLSAQRLHGVLEHEDGKVDIRIGDDGGPLAFIRAMFVVMQPKLVCGKDAEIWEKWASSVTGMKIIQGKWTPEHVDALVRGMERFLWDGGGSQQMMTEMVRKEYPQVKGTRIDIQLTDEIRARFSHILAGKK
jgi:hypothetical protein